MSNLINYNPHDPYDTLDEECFNTSYFYNKAMNVRKERHSKFNINEMMVRPTREFMIQYPSLISIINDIDRDAGNGHLEYKSWINTYYFPDNEDMERKLLVTCLTTLGFKVEVIEPTKRLKICLGEIDLLYQQNQSFTTTPKEPVKEPVSILPRAISFISNLFK